MRFIGGDVLVGKIILPCPIFEKEQNQLARLLTKIIVKTAI